MENFYQVNDMFRSNMLHRLHNELIVHYIGNNECYMIRNNIVFFRNNKDEFFVSESLIKRMATQFNISFEDIKKVYNIGEPCKKVISIEGIPEHVDDIQDDINAVMENKPFNNYEFKFTTATVQGLVNKINELSS